MSNINKYIKTDTEIMAGYSRQPGHWRGYSHNWNLLLPVNGNARLQFNGGYCTLPPNSLILIAPGGVRNFINEKDWRAFWVHFERGTYLHDDVEWEETIPGVWILPLKTADYRIMHHIFIQIFQTVSRRERFWKQLVYCLIQEAILRGNMIFGRGADSFDTALAHKMLTNLQENLSMDEIAEKCGLSRSAFFAKFTETFGISPRKYREHQLILTIKTLLETTDMSIRDICDHVHMSNPFYLSARFKSCCGISPREYRRKFRSAVENKNR